MSSLDQAIDNLEKMRDELMKASYTKDNFNSEWGNTLEVISHGLHRYASELKYKKNRIGGFDYA